MRLATLVLLASALAFGGCGSTRFGEGGPARVAAPRPGPVAAPPDEPVAEAVPSGSVTAAPLPPPPGSAGPADPGLPPPGPFATGEPPPDPVEVVREPERRQVAAVTGPGRLGVVGGWTAREATGATCRVQLSTTAALDLYKASASGCANRDLAGVTGWDFRDGEVFLYQPGGAVAARLREGGAGLEGVLAKSGAPLSLSR